MQNGVVATIQINLLADGNLQAGANCNSLFMLNGMLETAKQVLIAQMQEAAKNKVVLPDILPSGINLRN